MRKVQLTIKQEEVAPATTSDLVVMNNGKTLKEELSTNVLDKFSAELSVKTSVNEVSEHAYEGAYQNCILYGRSLVNLCPDTNFNHNRWIKFGYESINGNEITFVGNGQRLVRYAMLTIPVEANQAYTAYVQIKSDCAEVGLEFETSDGDTYVRSLSYVDAPTSEYKVIKCQITVKSHKTLRLVLRATNLIEGEVSFKEVVLLKGDDEEMNYFEGICSVKNPVIINTGKNLFNMSDEDNAAKTVNPSNGELTNGHSGYSTTDYIRVKPLETYIRQNDSCVEAAEYDLSKKYIRRLNWKNNKITISDRGAYVRFTYSDNKADVIQFEQSSIATSYEPNTSNEVRFQSEDGSDIVLRGLPDGTRDTLNVLTGEYVRVLDEITLNGTEKYTLKETSVEKDYALFSTPMPTNMKAYGVNATRGFISNNFINKSHYNQGMSTGFLNARDIVLGFPSTYTVNEVTQWLRDNPTTIVYEMMMPISKKVKVQGLPSIYPNGFIALGSDSTEQTVIPEMVYSVPTSKRGVIATTSKAILLHEEKIDKLEKLLLRESVLADYRIALEAFERM